MIYDSRKKELAIAVGNDEGCITNESWMRASWMDLNKELTLYPDDMKFLRNEIGYCTTTEEEELENQGVLISTPGAIKAIVIEDGEIIGETDTLIQLNTGAHTVTVAKDGYVSQDASFVVYAGKTASRYVILKKVESEEEEEEEEEPEEIEVTTPIGALIKPTMNTKGTAINEIAVGENTFGFEFRNIGDKTWYGRVGVKVYDEDGNVLFETLGSEARQNIKPNEIKYLWAYVEIPSLDGTPDKVTVLLTS